MDRKDALKWALWPLVIALVGASLWYFSPNQQMLRKCEDLIQAELMAPATYERVEYTVTTSNSVLVTYDAENAFGTPIRGSGSCNNLTGTLRWRESVL